MENKINIAELLKDCPKGMELDCTAWENVTFEKVVNDLIYVKRNNKDAPFFDKIIVLNKYGCCTDHKDEKCRIFPKDKNTWEGFVPPCQFKDGDVVYIKTKGVNHNEFIIIFKEIKNDHIHKHACFAYQVLYTNKNAVCHLVDVEIMRLATEEEKQKLFDAIKANGYRWNAKTKNLEKLPSPIFKIGQVVKLKGCPYNDVFWRISDIKNYQYIFNNGRIIDIDEQHHYELVSSKFNVDSLIPFESKVLVRTENSDVWEGDIFARYDRNATVNKFHCIGGWYEKCIPFKGNEWLLGTTDDCNDYYKTWKE